MDCEGESGRGDGGWQVGGQWTVGKQADGGWQRMLSGMVVDGEAGRWWMADDGKRADGGPADSANTYEIEPKFLDLSCIAGWNPSSKSCSSKNPEMEA